ncbi:unnamed protein product [marine sediment metagenome]|uniref:Uncharacterized protein n=1 Tax=marine sediment metagenome TaxID=412755 RepID=X1F1G2_9ZZZZ
MKGLVKLYARPKLNSPNMLAAWPGIGNVSIIVATYLERKLNFKRLGEIEASYFFDPIGVMVRDNVVEAPQFPESKFYYWKNKGGGSDIILFIGDDQPAAKGYELANCVLEGEGIREVRWAGKYCDIILTVMVGETSLTSQVSESLLPASPLGSIR